MLDPRQSVGRGRTVIWRLIVDGAVDGALNMALDRAAQLAREEGSAPPTVRLYSWSSPTVTLGRFQPVDAVDGSAVRRHGLSIARRFTGGRGVIHDDELTYCMVASTSDGVPRGVAASYLYLCGVLAAAYRALSVPAEVTGHDAGGARSEACYLSTTRADLTVAGRKLSGSAQVWTGSTVMQHGSFVFSRSVEREAAVFGLAPTEAERLRTSATTLGESASLPVGRDQVTDALIGAFHDVLGVELREGSWTARECEIAEGVLFETRVSPGEPSAST